MLNIFAMECVRIRRPSAIEGEKWVGVSIGKKDSSEIIRSISFYFKNKPKFIKRIKPGDDVLEILLCREREYSQEKDFEFLSSLGIENQRMFTVEVPKIEPKTAREIEIAQAMWPCTIVKPQIEECSTVPAEVERIIKKEKRCSSVDEGCAESSIILEDKKVYTVFSGIKEGEDSVFEHSVIRMVQNISRSTKDYLCTGKTVILSGEPCLVCGMALVHGRVRAIYIAGKKSEDGPYTKYSIHENKSLNHRIEVYMVS
ncbi:tRNA-specific adenosine deaminase 3 [Nematocida minor]|uniref:tRNA-specific adenosine deaminase 3 n=1 Tax=Nematocida minor TaxID=1912983 RepID=UPI00221F455B|nr:tRNA-specific adenosine deaminase 3 [Nematocida minor]KAI5192903.1 tRNA-specific adenosine deaminase 3 [Nematocida minor]